METAPTMRLLRSQFNAHTTILSCLLKGEYEDYTWGYGQNPLDYPVL